MSIQKIIQVTPEHVNDKQLTVRQSSVKVEKFDENFQKIVDDMIETIKSMKIGVGLAAPQISHNIQLFIANINEGKVEPTLVIVNPEIIKISGKKDKKFESCLCVPYYRGLVERRHKIEIKYQDRNGNFNEMIAEGFLARVFQHEIDHLSGILYTDRMKDEDKLEKVDFDWE